MYEFIILIQVQIQNNVDRLIELSFPFTIIPHLRSKSIYSLSQQLTVLTVFHKDEQYKNKNIKVSSLSHRMRNCRGLFLKGTKIQRLNICPYIFCVDADSIAI